MMRLRVDLLLDVDRHGRHLEVGCGPARPCPSRRAAGRATGRAGRASSAAPARRRRRSRAARSVGMFDPRVRVLESPRPGVGAGRLRLAPCVGLMPARGRVARDARRGSCSAASHGSVTSMNAQRPKPPWLLTAGTHSVARGVAPCAPCRVVACAGDLDDQVEQVVVAAAVVDADDEVGEVAALLGRRCVYGIVKPRPWFFT